MHHFFRLTVCALIGLGLGCKQEDGKSHPSKELTGSGSTFIQPMMEQWAAVFKREKDIGINYSGGGSTNGIKQMTDKATDFGCTDAPMTDEQIQKAEQEGGPVLHIPLVMGGVVPAYNLPGITKPVRFTGAVLADIFLGKIKKWSDKQLQELQEAGVTLPDQEIVTVHRAEGSGTTFIFTSYLSEVSPTWRDQVGAKQLVQWPIGNGEKGNPGVAGFVKRTAGAIGYVELIFVLKNEIQFGAVRNKAGKFLLASLESVTRAAEAKLKAQPPTDLTISIVDAPGDESYPICGTTWAILYQKQPADHGPAVKEFLTWATHAGQEATAKNKYAALPSSLVKLIDEKLGTIQIAK